MVSPKKENGSDGPAQSALDLDLEVIIRAAGEPHTLRNVCLPVAAFIARSTGRWIATVGAAREMRKTLQEHAERDDGDGLAGHCICSFCRIAGPIISRLDIEPESRGPEHPVWESGDTAPREIGLVCSAEEARRILESPEGVIRRTVEIPGFDKQPVSVSGPRAAFGWGFHFMADLDDLNYGDVDIHCPHGQPGDVLWIKERWALRGSHTDSQPLRDIKNNPAHFEVWRREQCFDGGKERFNTGFLGKWRPASDMPRWASRATLEILEIQVERAVQDYPLEKVKAGQWVWVIRFKRVEV